MEYETECEKTPTEPNWEVLKLLLDQAMDWMAYDEGEYGAAELEPLTLTYHMLFTKWDSAEARAHEIACRMKMMLWWVEGLHEAFWGPSRKIMHPAFPARLSDQARPADAKADEPGDRTAAAFLSILPRET
jgi:hypothetical protein